MGFAEKFGALVLAAAVGFGQEGCATRTNTYRPGVAYPEVELRGGLDTLRYDIRLGKGIQTAPIHPDDTNSPPAETTAKLGSSLANAIRLGVDTSFGDETTRLRIGTNVRYNFSYDAFCEDILEEKEQNTDVPGSKSFAFTRLTPDRFTYAMIVGAERKIYEKFTVGVQTGFTYTGFDVESGRDRQGRWETLKQDSWSGFGRITGLTFDVEPTNKVWRIFRGLSIFAGVEKFEPKINGEKTRIEAFTTSIGYKYRF